MQLSEFLIRSVPPAVVALDWPDRVERAAGGDVDAFAAVVGASPRLARWLSRRGQILGLEDTDAVLVAAAWAAVTRRVPSPDALYWAMREGLRSAARPEHRWSGARAFDADLEEAARHQCRTMSVDPVGEQAVTLTLLAEVPTEVWRVAAVRVFTSAPGSFAERQRLHRWRCRRAAMAAA